MGVHRCGELSYVEVDGERLATLDDIISKLQKYCDFATTKEDFSRPESVRHLLDELCAARDTIPRDLEIRKGDDARPARPQDIEAIAKAVNALYMAVWNRLLFLRGASDLAKESTTLLEDADVIEAAVPTPEQLEGIERNRRYLQRAIEWKMGQIERARALRNRGKTCQIRSVA